MESTVPSTLERLSCAMVSGNLKMKETVADVDFVAALGMVGQGNRMASALIHAHLAGDVASYKDVRRAAISLTRKMDAKRGWKLDTSDILRVADSAVKMYLLPVCPGCNGVKYLIAPGTPMLTDRPCPKCQGSGRRRYPIRDGRKISEVVHSLTGIEDIANMAVRRKMRSG